jgi:hypothetical protein
VSEAWNNFKKTSQLKLEDLTLAAYKGTGYRKTKRGKHREEKLLCEQVSGKRKRNNKEVL